MGGNWVQLARLSRAWLKFWLLPSTTWEAASEGQGLGFPGLQEPSISLAQPCQLHGLGNDPANRRPVSVSTCFLSLHLSLSLTYIHTYIQKHISIFFFLKTMTCRRYLTHGGTYWSDLQTLQGAMLQRGLQLKTQHSSSLKVPYQGPCQKQTAVLARHQSHQSYEVGLPSL